MMKQPHSATRLRLSKLFHWLAVLCFIKLSIFVALLMDMPTPTWLGGGSPEPTPQQVATSLSSPGGSIVSSATVPDTASGQRTPTFTENSLPRTQDASVIYSSDAEHAPQGSAAARLAAAARPRDISGAPLVDAALPAPVIRAGLSDTRHRDKAAGTQTAFNQHMPTPTALPAPQTPPHARTLVALATPNRAQESEMQDFFGLRHLPLPGLGSVQAAHAAALDMPVPQTPGTSAATSAFAPAAQSMPRDLPGTPPLPTNLPHGQDSNGLPLPQRSAAQGYGTGMPVPTIDRRNGSLQGTDMDTQMKVQELSRQQQDMLMLRQQMDQRLKDIQNTEKKMQDMIREAKGLEDEKVKRLILTYSNMKAKSAAKALENTEDRVAIRILCGMTPKQSGEIMTHMDPVRTAKLTELITRMRISD